MKKLSFALLFPSLVSCSYASKHDARDACEQWVAKMNLVTIASYRDEQPPYPADRQRELGQILRDLQEEDLGSFRNAERFREESKAFQLRFYEQLVFEDKKSREIVEHNVVGRWCVDDRSLMQVIGFENKSVVNGQWINQQGKKGKGEKVKFFRY